jgi:hypothetical protein
MRDNEFTKILGWPVYRQELDEAAKTLRLWVRRKQGKVPLAPQPVTLKHSHSAW